MNFSDNFFNKVEKKTNVKKSTILDLAKKLQGDNMKNEDNIRDVMDLNYMGTLLPIQVFTKDMVEKISIFTLSIVDNAVVALPAPMLPISFNTSNCISLSCSKSTSDILNLNS